MCDSNEVSEEMNTKNTKLYEYFFQNYNLQVLSYSSEAPQNVLSLNLTNIGIKSLDRQILNLTSNIQTIDLSYNLLNDLSYLEDIDLPQLKKLDLKHNMISNFVFVANLKSLEDLDIRGNNFDSSVLYWIVCHLPKLKLLNGEDITDIRKYMQMTEIQVISNIDSVFNNEFEVSLKNTEFAIIEMKTKLINSLFKKCGVIKEAEFALQCKVQQLLDDRLNNVIKNIMTKMVTDPSISKCNGGNGYNKRNPEVTKLVPQKKELKGLKSDILTKAITETIGELNVDIKPSIPSMSINKSNICNEKKKSGESLNLNTNALKRKPSLPEVQDQRVHNRNSCSFPLSYELVKILRKHSRETDINDSKTSIWDIKYRPIGRSYCGTDLVVTCGGNIVNLIDLKSGSVCKRYEDSNSLETFNCIVWRDFIVNTTNGMTRNLSLLCVGATKKDNKLTNILFLNGDDMSDFFKIRSHSQSVNCLLFHPIKTNLLFSGSYDRKIMVWKLDSGKMTHISRFSSLTVHKLMEIDCNNRILSSVFAKNLDVLVVSGEDGIVLIKPLSNTTDKKDNTCLTYRIDIPEKKKVVDGLVMVAKDSNLIAFRLKQMIIIADLKKMLESADSKGVVPLEVVTRLRYCPQKCDYFYMTIESRLLCCGSADGQILLYYLKDSILKSSQKENLLDPIRVLLKPQLNNYCLKSESFIKPLSESLFVNIAAISPNHEYIVSGTNTNLICIWKRTNSSQTPSHSSSNSGNKKIKSVSFL